jgi:hypothetical protein
MEQVTTNDRGVLCPVNQPMTKVIIHVEGGLVQAVYSAEELDIQVYDLDLSDFATTSEVAERKVIAADLAKEIKGLKQIY